mgnify:FL=1
MTAKHHKSSRKGHPQDSEPQQNRRAHPRHGFDRTATAAELDESGIPGPSWTCRVFDLSRSGLGIRSRRMVYTGRLLLIEVHDGTQDRPRVFCGMVRQSRYEASEGHILGIQFWPLPKSAAIEQWIHDRANAA